MKCISFGLFNVFQFSSFLKSQFFYIHILTLFAKIFFTVPIMILDQAKHFLHAAVLVLVATKCSGLGHKRLTLSPWVLPSSKLDTLATLVTKRPTQKPYPSFMQGLVCNKTSVFGNTLDEKGSALFTTLFINKVSIFDNTLH